MYDPGFIALLALVFDALMGDPPWLYRRIPHPVALMGGWIARAEERLNSLQLPRARRVHRGALLTAGAVLLAALAGWLIASVLAHLPLGWLLEALVASTLLAFRSLYDHVAAVENGLRSGIVEARGAVAHIVGRDPESLDESGIARAAVESLAENFSDGVVAPVFWFLLLGLPGLLAYKVVNTLDSMIGYRNERYEAFGKAAARLDDAVNWVPARLAGGCFCLAALLYPGASARQAWQVMLRDAPKHRSVNAGWPEAAVAGGLGFALAGPRRYGDRVVDDHWMGNGRSALSAGDVHRALGLSLMAGGLLVASVLVVWLV